jgi:hypothetical protein
VLTGIKGQYANKEMLSLTDAMGHSRCREADSHSANQETPHLYGTSRFSTVFVVEMNDVMS